MQNPFVLALLAGQAFAASSITLSKIKWDGQGCDMTNPPDGCGIDAKALTDLSKVSHLGDQCAPKVATNCQLHLTASVSEDIDKVDVHSPICYNTTDLTPSNIGFDISDLARYQLLGKSSGAVASITLVSGIQFLNSKAPANVSIASGSATTVDACDPPNHLTNQGVAAVTKAVQISMLLTTDLMLDASNFYITLGDEPDTKFQFVEDTKTIAVDLNLKYYPNSVAPGLLLAPLAFILTSIYTFL